VAPDNPESTSRSSHVLACIRFRLDLQKFVLETRIEVAVQVEQELTARAPPEGAVVRDTKIELMFTNPSRVATSIVSVQFITNEGRPLAMTADQQQRELGTPFPLPARAAVLKTLSIDLADGQPLSEVVVTHLDGIERIKRSAGRLPAVFNEHITDTVHTTDSVTTEGSRETTGK